MTVADLSAARAFVLAQDISAVYPDPAAFKVKVDAATTTAQREAAGVSTFAGYRAALKRFMNTLDDEHAGVAFAIGQTRLFWPGFVMRRLGGRYVVAASIRPEVRDGAVITACDGRPADVLVAQTAIYEGGHPGLESTKASGALAALIDSANPFLTRPTTCTIEGRSVTLRWERIYYADYARQVLPLAGTPDLTTAVTRLPDGIAWVRLGDFDPETPAQIKAFRRLVSAAPSLRNARAIVLDVRQNGGGPYDWMMAFLNSLYGQAYADNYARARLVIHPVYRATPEVLAMFRQSDAQDVANGAPQDSQTDNGATRGVADSLAAGRPYFRAASKPLPPQSASAPPSPVKGPVFVLTDFGCGSVCIGFVDELKRFPGVLQIGSDTFVDNRTGTPMTQLLPSGAASIYVPVMTRDGRDRGDNVPQHPSIVFSGDTSDTKAVQRWVRDTVLAISPATAAATNPAASPTASAPS